MNTRKKILRLAIFFVIRRRLNIALRYLMILYQVSWSVGWLAGLFSCFSKRKGGGGGGGREIFQEYNRTGLFCRKILATVACVRTFTKQFLSNSV